VSHATLDRVLAVLVVSMAATGLLSLRAGAADTAWVFTLHAVLGGSLLAATALKLRRSVPRAAKAGRWRRLALGSLVSLGVVAALTGGFLWVASGEMLTVGSWTILTLHAWVGLLVVPLVVVHLLPHRWRVLRLPPRNGVSRRTVLAGGGLALAGLGTFGLAAMADQMRGGVRRFTGSRWLPTGGIPPVTTFFGEGTPSIDAKAWRLTVRTRTSAHSWTLDALLALGETGIAAVLDCTSGWAIETGWRGVPLAVLLDASETSSSNDRVRVTSVTGWSADLTMDEARGAFLATGVGGVDLPAGNGAPCRLVLPDHRGLDWVKWVSEIRVG
jgi:Oxidoreductase molybdopterin binding domain